MLSLCCDFIKNNEPFSADNSLGLHLTTPALIAIIRLSKKNKKKTTQHHLVQRWTLQWLLWHIKCDSFTVIDFYAEVLPLVKLVRPIMTIISVIISCFYFILCNFFFTLQLVLDLGFVCYLENSSSGYTACVFSSISFCFFCHLNFFLKFNITLSKIWIFLHMTWRINVLKIMIWYDICLPLELERSAFDFKPRSSTCQALISSVFIGLIRLTIKRE